MKRSLLPAGRFVAAALVATFLISAMNVWDWAPGQWWLVHLDEWRTARRLAWYLATCAVVGLILRGMRPWLAPLAVAFFGMHAHLVTMRAIQWGRPTATQIRAMEDSPWTWVVDWGFVLTGLWLSYLVARPARASHQYCGPEESRGDDHAAACSAYVEQGRTG
jgi:hypothetical protein